METRKAAESPEPVPVTFGSTISAKEQVQSSVHDPLHRGQHSRGLQPSAIGLILAICEFGDLSLIVSRDLNPFLKCDVIRILAEIIY